jgi:hypothetical protein
MLNVPERDVAAPKFYAAQIRPVYAGLRSDLFLAQSLLESNSAHTTTEPHDNVFSLSSHDPML